MIESLPRTLFFLALVSQVSGLMNDTSNVVTYEQELNKASSQIQPINLKNIDEKPCDPKWLVCWV